MKSIITEFAGHRLLLTSVGDRLTACLWTDSPKPPPDISPTEAEQEILDMAVSQLNAYFSGILKTFSLPLKFEGTDFRKRVWNALLSIPYGHTISYSELARRSGMPGSTRAVANACGANPMEVIIPCHRVVALKGDGGYKGGIDIKRALLELERKSQNQINTGGVLIPVRMF